MVLYNMRNRMIATAGSAIASIPYRNQAIAARFGYGYKERYLAEVNGSYTGSENFAPRTSFRFLPGCFCGLGHFKRTVFQEYDSYGRLVEIACFLWYRR